MALVNQDFLEREQQRTASSPYRYPDPAEMPEPENVDRLLNQISNALAHAHAEMERIAPSPTAPEPNEKTLRVPTVVEDLTQILFLVNRLGERIDVAASRLGRIL